MDSSSSSSLIWKHHVYPSFHGPDVRKTILAHTLKSFTRKGIITFIDNNTERGTSISESLIEGLRGSEIAIVILSSNYASSSWSLDELVLIMKCKEELGQIVFPVFYEVCPSDVKKQSGYFGDMFKETCKSKTKERILGWIKALEHVAVIAGEFSANWTDEGDMIEKIATDVLHILKRYPPYIESDDVVGMRAHMEMMQKLLRLELDEVRVIGIWGPPGIGKTTIAKVLYKQISYRFQLATFMADIKSCYLIPCLDDIDAQLRLQREMISNLGVEKEQLKDKKVLLVLDDADLLHLNALMKEIQGFGYGSRIILVTENLSLLKEYRIKDFHKVNFPSWDEAFQIFCMHAFGDKQPDDGFEDISWEVVALAGSSTPKNLKLLASVVRGMSRLEWEKILPRLKRNEIIVKPPQFQVFINYRGDELRNSFVGHLVAALQRSEINVFADYQEQRGEDLSVLFKRIEDSRVAIVVFSNRYTESKWCLNELAMIKERAQTGHLKVLPIFFNVNTTDVGRLKGVFGDHFRDQEHKYSHDEPLIKRWKEAISDVSHILGRTFYEKSNMRESEFVEIIVKDVLEKLQAISNEERGQSGLREDDNDMTDYVRTKQDIAREKLLELNKSVVVRVSKLFAFPMVLSSVLVCFSIFLYFCFVEK